MERVFDRDVHEVEDENLVGEDAQEELSGLVGKSVQEEEAGLFGEICMQQRVNDAQEEESGGLVGGKYGLVG